MRLGGFLFILLMTQGLCAQQGAFLQQGIGAVMNTYNQVDGLKQKAAACKFGSSQKRYVYELIEEHNKECVIQGDSSKLIDVEKSSEIETRQKAKQYVKKMQSSSEGCWDFSDFLPQEITRLNQITNPAACAGQAVNVMQQVGGQVLQPLLGNVMPGAENLMGGGGGGQNAIQSILGNIGGQ